jgi:hypothetical protein
MKFFIIGLLLILNFFILNLWIWLIKYIFPTKLPKYIIVILAIIGLISGGSILFYPHILSYIWLADLDFTNQKIEILSNFSTLLLFLIYLSILNILVYTFLIKKSWKIFSILLGSYIVNALIIWFLANYFHNNPVVIYYLYVGIGEELVKFFLALILFLKFWKNITDIITFSILSAISFAFIENFVYLFGSIKENINIALLIGGTALLVSRGIVWFVAHLIFTWSIWHFVYKYFLSRKLWLLTGFWFGILIHFLYDLLLTYQYNFVIPVLIIGGYIWLSYLFYNADRFYKSYIDLREIL